MKLRYTILKELIMLKKKAESQDITEVTKAVNLCVKIINQHVKEIDKKKSIEDFSDINGIDFNTWAYDTIQDIENVYHLLKDKFHDLHWEKHGFNVYEVPSS